LKVFGCLQFFGFCFRFDVVPSFELVNALLIDVKTDNGTLFAKFNNQRQTDVAQSNDGQFDFR